VAISGQGPAPAALTIERARSLGVGPLLPGEGLLAATVPAFVDAWLLALARYGTRSVARVLAPAIEVAREGWPCQRGLAAVLRRCAGRFGAEWPTSGATFLPGGEPPAPGDRVRNPDLARTLAGLAAAAEAAPDRAAGVEAARVAFYAGDVARAIDAHARAGGGLLRAEDLAAYRGRVEAPLQVDYRGVTVSKCATWTQGAVFLQQLRLLEGFDLRAMGHNTADYLHTWLECAKLAFADREVAYGDPDRADVPLERLLSPEYAAERRARVDPARASDLLRPGDRPAYRCAGAAGAPPDGGPAGGGEPSAFMGDTTHVDAADRFGNLVAATPSGGWLSSSPVVDGLGFPLGTRAQMFSLDPGHPNALAPGKRPRSTLSPSLAHRDGRAWLAFGTPGGDMQDQWTLQAFLNVVEFGMDLQAALDAPTVHTLHAPASFHPRAARPGVASAEGRIDPAVLAELRRRGHAVEVPGDWEHGRAQIVAREADGWLAGAVSPRRETGYAVGW